MSEDKGKQLDAEQIRELFDTVSERLRRRHATARVYVVGGVCMVLGYGRRRSTVDVDGRIDEGHGALTDIVQEIARERGLGDSWLNEQATSAIPRGKDHRARTLYASPSLVITGAGPQHMLAMKLEAGRDRDVGDIEWLLKHLKIEDGNDALEMHAQLLPDSRRKGQAWALLSALADENDALAAPTGEPDNEREWLEAIRSDEYPRYECTRASGGLSLTVQRREGSEREVIGEKLTLHGVALLECADRGWPTEAVEMIKGFTAGELGKQKARGRVRT